MGAKTPDIPAARANSSSWWMGLKSPDAPAYRVSCGLLVDVDDPGPAQVRFPRAAGAEQLELLLAVEDTCEMSVPRSRSNAPVSAVSSRKVTAKVGGAIKSPHAEAAPTRSSR
jgi:hypothetical protein